MLIDTQPHNYLSYCYTLEVEHNIPQQTLPSIVELKIRISQISDMIRKNPELEH